MTSTGAAVQTAAYASSSKQRVTLDLDLGNTGSRVYFVMTNESSTAATAGLPTLGNEAPVSRPVARTLSRPVLPRPQAIGTPPEIIAANRAAVARIGKAPSRSVFGPNLDSSQTPYTGTDIGSATMSYKPYGGGTSIPCTLEAYVDQSGSSKGRKLFVWVETASLDAATSTSGTYTYTGTQAYTGLSGSAWKPFKVTRAQAQALAAKFLNATTDDIYSYDTSIFGKEYYDVGGTPAAGLITPRGEIHIFIVDLNPTSSYKGQGGTLGYFYGGDNFQTGYSDSNQKIMFQLDAGTLGNPTADGSVTFGGNPLSPGTGLSSPAWSLATSYWPNQQLSTLAHEFQHMIHFYQKQVIFNLNTNTDTWINEMCSMVAEDFVASKLGTLGPRGVELTNSGTTFAYQSSAGDLLQFNAGTGAVTSPAFNDPYSRMAYFNDYYAYISLQSWGDTYSNNLSNYGMAYSFGAWLARNFGGTALFTNIVQSAQTDESAVVNAVNQYIGGGTYTMTDLIEAWAATMVMGSKAISVPYSLAYNNYGGFESGTIDPSKYYPYYYDAQNPSYSGFEPVDGVLSGGPLVYNHFSASGLASIRPRGFFYYTPSTSNISGPQHYVVTIPANVRFDVVTVR